MGSARRRISIRRVYIHSIFIGRKRDTRFLAIELAHDVDDEGEVIAAVGQCLGSFKVFSSSHSAMINVPLKILDSKDFVCLVDKLGGVEHSMSIKLHEGF